MISVCQHYLCSQVTKSIQYNDFVSVSEWRSLLSGFSNLSVTSVALLIVSTDLCVNGTAVKQTSISEEWFLMRTIPRGCETRGNEAGQSVENLFKCVLATRYDYKFIYLCFNSTHLFWESTSPTVCGSRNVILYLKLAKPQCGSSDKFHRIWKLFMDYVNAKLCAAAPSVTFKLSSQD